MANYNPLPPLERLQQLLHYDTQEGVLRWRVSQGRAKAGSEAGYVEEDGYVEVRVDGVRYKAHRIAYYMGTGVDPLAHQVDHCPDPTRTNNRLANLRLAVDSADNCSTRRRSPTQAVVIAYPDGLLIQCPSQYAAARTLGCCRKTLRRSLRMGTPLATGHRVYAYPRAA